MPAATAHATIRHDASGLRACRAHVAHLLWRSGGSCGTRFVLFVCEGNDTDYCLVACFWCSFADSECAFGAGCQLRLRMLRSGMMHRGCGRPVRTLRPFLYDRAAPSAPVLYFLCAKQMTPIVIFGPAFGAPLLIRSALSAPDASCEQISLSHVKCARIRGTLYAHDLLLHPYLHFQVFFPLPLVCVSGPLPPCGCGHGPCLGPYLRSAI